MARKKLSMRKIREVARLKASGLSVRQIARSCNIARSTAADYLSRLDAAGLSWPLPPEMDGASGSPRPVARRSGAARRRLRPTHFIPQCCSANACHRRLTCYARSTRDKTLFVYLLSPKRNMWHTAPLCAIVFAQ